MADWQRVKSIFEELIELPREDRSQAIQRLCSHDAELRAAVEDLLTAHERAGTFLGSPTGSHRLTDTVFDGNTNLDEMPARIGPYTPLEKIGEGGFGSVYRAQQESPVRRIVALKVIKPGMDTREVIARFESERQALALMSHPNIAGVLDAGATPQGRPYFVMEFVPGEPITAYCDRTKLNLQQRLQLFVQVCHAVQHAHQKGIIHRDIKPSNVLVIDEASKGERRPVAKVIDFGVAKATDQRLTEHSILTLEGVLVGTPEYMSPEQAEPGLLDIDTRTDIYSLGVLLYELLTGTLPFSPRTLRSKGFAEIQRIVREVEPPKPSTRYSVLLSAGTTDARNRLTERRRTQTLGDFADSKSASKAALQIAQCRDMDPAALSKTLRGDLDWIVMKCLEKDRARRYETANSVAQEVERYLRHEPVLAGPPGAAYRLRKFARRNRVAIAAIAATTGALAIGLIISVAGFMAALRARDVADGQRRLAQKSAEEARDSAAAAAEQQQLAQANAAKALRAARKAEAVNQFLQDTLSEADPRYSAQRDTTVRESLDRAIARLDAGAMGNEPEIEAAIRLTIGRTLSGLAQFSAAEVQVGAALDAYQKLFGNYSPEYAEAVHERGCIRKLAGRPEVAEADFRASLAIQRDRGAEGQPEAAICANDLAVALLSQKKFDQAGPLVEEVLQFARQQRNADKPILAEAVNNKGSLLLAQHRFDEAEPYFREAIEVNRRVVGEPHPNIATNLDNLAQSLHGKGDLPGALAAYTDALAIRRQLYGDDHPDVATTLHNLAVLYFAQENIPACETALRESRAIFERIHGLVHPETQLVTDSLVSVVAIAGKLDEAERLMIESYEAVHNNPAADRNRELALASRLLELYQALQRTESAAEWAQRVTDLRKAQSDAPQRAITTTQPTHSSLTTQATQADAPEPTPATDK